MGYIHFCNSDARLLLLPRPSLRSREKTGLPQGFSVFSFWGIALSPIHRWTVWHKGSQSTPGQLCRPLSQSTYKTFSFFTLPQFSLFFMFHGKSNILQIVCHFFHRTPPLLSAPSGAVEWEALTALIKRIQQKWLCDHCQSQALRHWQFHFLSLGTFSQGGPHCYAVCPVTLTSPC